MPHWRKASQNASSYYVQISQYNRSGYVHLLKNGLVEHIQLMGYNSVVPNLEPPDVLGIQLPEALTTTSAGQDFWELKSKNIWRPKVGDPCCGLHEELLCM